MKKQSFKGLLLAGVFAAAGCGGGATSDRVLPSASNVHTAQPFAAPGTSTERIYVGGNAHYTGTEQYVAVYRPGTRTPIQRLSSVNGSWAADPSGNIYVADLTKNRVLEYSPSSKLVRTIVDAVSDPTAVAADTTGKLYVGNWRNNSISEYATGSTKATTVISSAGDPVRLLVDGLGDAFDFSGGSDAYVGEFVPGQSHPIVAARKTPVQGSVSSDGSLYALFSPTSHSVAEYAPRSLKLVRNITGPTIALGVAAGPHGIVYVSYINNTIAQYASTGTKPQQTLNQNGLMAVDSAGNLFVLNTSLSGVCTLTEYSGTPLRSVWSTTTDLHYPNTLSVSQ